MMKGRRITAVLCLMAVITVFVGCTYDHTTAQRAETAGQEKSRIEKQEENGEAKELMTDLRAYLEKKLREIISQWDEEDIYAVSFFVYANEENEYGGYTNVPEFFVSYNTQSDCAGADELSEERWNYAFWRQNEIPVIQACEGDEGMQVLFNWYKENGIDNIGYEDYDADYDSQMRYIGKGPAGYYELLGEITAVANKLQSSGFIEGKFGRPIPIIIHDLEYPWYIIEATRKANPGGEADTFLAAMQELGFTE